MSGNGFISKIRRLIDPEERLTMSNFPSPFAQLRSQMDDILGDGGILKEVVQSGGGPPVPENASLLIHYSAFLEYSNRPFETTTYLKYPRMMKLGKDVTLLGLHLGVLTMKKGEFSRFLFKPNYAYGEMGCPPLIPAAAEILYEVHIVDYFDSAQMDDFVALSLEEQNSCPLSTLIKVATTIRGFGNRCFNQRNYYDAKDHYKQAARLLGNRETQNNADKGTVQTALLPLYLNLSLTELRLDRPHKALKYSDKALKIDSTNTKALFRCGQAYLDLHEYESAQHYLISAQAKKPFDVDINNLLRRVAMCYKESIDQQKELYSKMFKHLRSPMKK